MAFSTSAPLDPRHTQCTAAHRFLHSLGFIPVNLLSPNSTATPFLRYCSVLTYIDVSATAEGVSPEFSFYLIAIANASSLFGRYASGILSDKTGEAITALPFPISSLISLRLNECHDSIHIYCWYTNICMAIRQNKGHAHSCCDYIRVNSSPQVTFSRGCFSPRACRFASGSYVALLSNPLMEMGDTRDVGRRIGMFMSILALGAVAGPPISGAINLATGSYKAVGYYAGSWLFDALAPPRTARC